MRIAHHTAGLGQGGFDRLVFEFGPSTAPVGTFGMPPYRVQVASAFIAPSGQPVTVTGNAFFEVRFDNASTVSPTDASRSYTGPSSIRPTTPLVREIRLVEDFERVLIWGVGLDHLACPAVMALAGPVRLVLDFPTPP